MARTGISIVVGNTVFGGTPNVDKNSMLVVAGASAVSSGTVAFSLGTAYMLTSLADLDAMDITDGSSDANLEVYRQVQGFYAPKQGVDNTGTILWLVGVATLTSMTAVVAAVRSTILNGTKYRPRNILLSQIDTFAARPLDPDDIQTAVDLLYTEGFATVVILGDCLRGNAASMTLEDLSTQDAPMVGVLVVKGRDDGKRASVGRVGGFMSTLTVGTSIGDASLKPFDSDMVFVDMSDQSTYINTNCSSLSLTRVNELGEAQYIFARTRMPFNGLWLNDGATCVDSATSLSTLEAARTLASIVDELRTYLTPYLNTRVPVTSDGDIAPVYKQLVISGADDKVIRPYIASGDISDARIQIAAKDDDMVGTKTWQVSLSVLPAPTLRWIDGYVFYVKSI